MTHRTVLAWQILWTLAAGVFLILYASSCSETAHTPPPVVTLPPAAAAAGPVATTAVTAARAVQTPLAAATQANVTPENFPTEYPKLFTLIGKAWQASAQAVSAALASETASKAKDAEASADRAGIVAGNKTITDLTAANDKLVSEVAKLNEKLGGFWHSLATWAIGIGMFLSFAAIVLGVYIGIKGDLMNGVAAGGAGAAGLIVGIVFMTVADFFESYKLQIGIGLCVVVAIVLGVVGWLAYKRLHDGAVSIVKGVQAGIASGAIPMGSQGPIFKAVETPLAAALVDAHAKEMPVAHAIPVQSPLPTPGVVTYSKTVTLPTPNPTAAVNDPSNVTGGK